MNKKIGSILLFSFLALLPKNSYGALGEFTFGVGTKTTYIHNLRTSLKNYYLFNTPNKEQPLALMYELENDRALNIRLVPLTVSAIGGVSYFFTESLGISGNIEYGYGNIIVCNIDKNKYDTLTKKNAKEIQDTLNNYNKQFSSSNRYYQLTVHSLDFDVRIKYDFTKNTLNFNNYEREGYSLAVSFGPRFKCFLSRTFTQNGAHDFKMESDEEKKQKVRDNSNRIASWNIGAVVGVSATTPYNFGIAVDIIGYFKGLFVEPSEKLEEEKNVTMKLDGNAKLKKPSYDTYSPFVQGGVSIFYDFAPIINNHSEPTEIDIEKW